MLPHLLHAFFPVTLMPAREQPRCLALPNDYHIKTQGSKELRCMLVGATLKSTFYATPL